MRSNKNKPGSYSVHLPISGTVFSSDKAWAFLFLEGKRWQAC